MSSKVVTHLICTVGTSYLGRLKTRYCPKSEDVLKDLPQPQFLALEEAKRTDDQLKADSAEINSILTILPQVGGRIKVIDLFISDTDDGVYMGKLYEALLPRIMDGERMECRLDSVRLTQVTDLKPVYNRFSPFGLKNLVIKMVERIRDIRARDNGVVAINATGGYKAQISFAGLIGQVMDCDVWYQFEDFKTSVRMPPMPVSFSMELWLDNWELFDTLSEEAVVSFADLGITPEGIENSSLGSLFETEDDSVLLNPIGQLFHERFREQFARERELLLPPSRTGEPKDAIGDHNWENKLIEIALKVMHEAPYVTRLTTESWTSKISDKVAAKAGDNVSVVKCRLMGDHAIALCYYTTATTRNQQKAAMIDLTERLRAKM